VYAFGLGLHFADPIDEKDVDAVLVNQLQWNVIRNTEPSMKKFVFSMLFMKMVFLRGVDENSTQYIMIQICMS
jgi:hypothetical protein